jgi:hypothetical protein
LNAGTPDTTIEIDEGLQALFAPPSIVVISAGLDTRSAGLRPIRCLDAAGFGGTCLPSESGRADLDEYVSDVSHIDDPHIDLAVLMVNRERTMPTVA